MARKDEQDLVVAPAFTPAVITADWEGIEASVASMLEPYEGVTAEVAATMDLEEAKACCTDLRRISKELNDGRKAIKRAYNEPLAAFEARIKAIDERIKGPLAVIDEAVKIEEQAARDRRFEALAKAYGEFAPAIAAAVPFERVCERQWLNKSVNEMKAMALMEERVARIAEEHQTFERVRAGLAFPEECEHAFWETLSVAEATKRDEALKAQEERLAAMREQMPKADPRPEPAPEPPAPEPEPRLSVRGQEEAPEVPQAVYALALSATPQEAAALKALLRDMGFSGRLLRTPLKDPQTVIDIVKEALDA